MRPELTKLARRAGAALVWPVKAPWRALRGTGRLLGSFRTWVVIFCLIVLVLVAYYAAADRYTPMTSDAYVQAYVVQVAGRVEGQVVRVHVLENERVKKGDLLFEIDPRPFQHAVARLEARLAYAVQQVAQLRADHEAARAEHVRLEAEERYAGVVHSQEKGIYAKKATTERKYLDAEQRHVAAKALVEKSAQLVQRAADALKARIQNEHALIAEVKAELATAKLNLEFTRVYAPADGFITNLQLREGSYAHIGQPLLTCIDDSQWLIVANFRETCLERMAAGQPCLVSFNNYPGRLFDGRVYRIGWGVSQGQGTPSGQLPTVPNVPGWIRVAQRFQVRIELDDPSAVPLRVGMRVAVSVYPDRDHFLKPVTEAFHQFLAWLDFLL
ncbi:MAG: HlyD family secretion protein [Planctomycetes bacterium]|nr:HlyD family secretion protein [Planctomycetota bacterium]